MTLTALWRILIFWRRPLAPRPSVLVFPGPPRAADPPKARKRVDIGDVHEQGEFYFKDNILDQLDRSFKILRRLKKADRHGYEFFSKVGAQVVPSQSAAYWRDQAPDFWAGALPAIGGVLFGACHPNDDKSKPDAKIYPSLVYFQKFNPRKFPNTEMCGDGSHLYTLTVYWKLDDPDADGIIYYPVAILPDGKIKALRQIRTDGGPRVVLRHRFNQPQEVVRIPARSWGYDRFATSWAEEHGRSVEEMLTKLFAYVVQTWEQATVGSMVRVAASKDKLICVFSVNILRTPYFFADREKGDGKKIFHIVRAHERLLGNSVTMVRTHFRGLRRFVWNGHDIVITVPGWHHKGLEAFDVEGEEWGNEALLPPDRVTMGEVGGWIAEKLRHADGRPATRGERAPRA